MKLKYKEVSIRELKKMSDSEKLEEIRRAESWIAENYINHRDAKEHNFAVYVTFADIVQRIVKCNEKI